MGRLLRGSVEIDGHRSVANSDDDPLVRINAGIPFTMHDLLGDAAEVSGRDLDAFPPARTEFDEEPAADAVGICVMAGLAFGGLWRKTDLTVESNVGSGNHHEQAGLDAG